MKASAHYILLVVCPDEQGLIHKITGAIYRHKLNIIENHEHVGEEDSIFVMRTLVSGEINESALIKDLKSELPKSAQISLKSKNTKKKLVLLATKEPHCLGDLLLRHSAGELNADLLAVISQHDSLRKLTERFEIPYHHVPVADLSRLEHEQELEKVINPYKPDLLVLAKYMRIFDPSFVKKYEGKIINIHHSFLPAFKGANPYAQAYERGVKIIGATAHFVNNDLDEGPIITQDVIHIDHTKNAAELSRAGKDIERLVLAKGVKLALEDRVILRGSRTLVFD